ncbi:hypothetical protein HDA43_004569 [Streptosporangium sandarakinum]|uniref:Uncharacterized protein n=1 Tax=Streptosporangium sandarakinum TaxID=1260955 RepID=A0A852V444_9ACTN|nr:hypothetical protein [Streptosporangium sandarakinum]
MSSHWSRNRTGAVTRAAVSASPCTPSRPSTAARTRSSAARKGTPRGGSEDPLRRGRRGGERGTATAARPEPGATDGFSGGEDRGRSGREQLRRAGRTVPKAMARRWVGVPAGFKTPETTAPEARPKAGRNQSPATTPAGTPTHRSAHKHQPDNHRSAQTRETPPKREIPA